MSESRVLTPSDVENLAHWHPAEHGECAATICAAWAERDSLRAEVVQLQAAVEAARRLSEADYIFGVNGPSDADPDWNQLYSDLADTLAALDKEAARE